jgi:hypothetical protein
MEGVVWGLNPFPVAISAMCALLGREEKMA